MNGKAVETEKDVLDNSLPWVEKYRPPTMDDMYGQQDVVNTIRKFIKSDRLPHLLFYGPPGTGKTSLVLAMARELYGKHFKYMVLELNASDDRGIDVVREQIKTFASTRQFFKSQGDNAPKFKLIILDEADSMTSAAQNALRRIMERYTQSTRFCILANYAYKLIPAIQSRCTKFRFSPLPIDVIDARVKYVVGEEHVNITADGEKALVDLSKGDMRRALNVLQACYAAVPEGEAITDNIVYDSVGSPQPADLDAIFNSLLSEKWESAVRSIHQIKLIKGIALADILSGILPLIDKLDLKPMARMSILEGMADVEYRLCTGGSEKIQTTALVGVVKCALELQA